MAVGTERPQAGPGESAPADAPTLSICESGPGNAVLLEEDNTDGWIASDTTCDVTR